jgi:hypothetical protein
MRNRTFHFLGACTVAAITAAFAMACADQPTAVLDDRLGPGDVYLGVTGTPNQQDWRQCRNNHDRETECAWITSTLNATHNTYFEGDMVPKVLRVPNIVGNEPFDIVMTYGFLHGGKTTHDFLGRWNLDMVNANPCTNSRYSAFCTNGALDAITTESNSMAALSQAAVNEACGTRPEMQAAMTAAILAVGANDLVIEAIDFAHVQVTDITFDGCPVSGNAEAYLTMRVTPVAGKTEGLLLFGAHVARGFDWPNGGAGDVKGSPYHLGLVSVDGQAAGSMDLQMAANAIVVPGSITVEKVCIGSSEGTFDYTGTVPGGDPLAPFDLECGETLTVVEGTDFGQYTITEDVPTGWELTDIECSAGSTSLATATATVDLAEGQHVHCTFENTRQGTITIVKNTIGGDGTFDYTAGGAPLANFSITTVGNTGNEVFNNVAPGAYTVTEDGPPAGWEFVSLVCVGNGPAGSVVGQTANIDLEAGGSVTCTYTNREQGTITIVKNTIGGDGTFDYTAGGAPLANFSITTVGNTGSEVFNNVSPGSYTVTEDGPPAGWEFVSLVCVGNGAGGSVVGQTANIDLEAGGSVTCTYTNQELGTITIVKNTIGGDGTFDYTAGGAPLANFSITTVAGTGNEVFNNVSPGAYTVTEDGPPAGWVFVSLVCVGNGPAGSVVGQTANIDLVAGGSVTCTFTNELIPEAEDETAWASNTLDCCTIQFDPDRGWATYVEYDGSLKIVGFYAGQTIYVGTVTFSAVDGGNVTIDIELEGGWSFQAGSVVAVQGYDDPPTGNPSPGQFANKEPASGTTHTIVVPQANFYAVHAVVE